MYKHTQFAKHFAAVVVALPLASAPLHAQTHWVGSWAASQQIPEPQNALPAADLTDATLRETVHLTLGGTTLRMHFSNAFGTEPLHITAAHIAHPTANNTGAVDPTTDRALTFSGRADVTIPAGAEYLSDPIAFPAAPLSDITVSFHLDTPPARQTGHPGSRAVIFYAHGDQTAAPTLTGAKHAEHWYTLSAVDVATAPQAFAVIAFGDSITDGHGATTNGNDRWPDMLARRLQGNPKFRNIAVLNQGIGGNHMLTDGLGPNALARFDRDVLAQTSARTVILLEGVNDLGKLSLEQPNATPEEHAALVRALIASYQQFIDRAHARGIRVIGATITPYTGSGYYHPATANEADRVALNTWIRTPGHFDAVVDFDKVLADPADPTRLLPAYDSGDHLHPSTAGYKAMADTIPLNSLLP
jgi:lysophospholipase L1-like esterase